MPTKYLSRKFLLTANLNIVGCFGFVYSMLQGNQVDMVGFAAFVTANNGAYMYFDNTDPHKHDS